MVSWNHQGRARLRAATAALAVLTSAQSVFADETWYLPPETGQFDYQLAGRYQAADDVWIVSSDSGVHVDGSPDSDQPLDASRYNICYLNALQSQPQDAQFWLDNYPDLILTDAAGDPVHDPDKEWNEELLFDVSTSAKQQALLSIESSWIEACRTAGFLAIEPDNLDAASRSQGLLDDSQVQSFMALFVAEAHRQGLAVAQKNAADWVLAEAGEVAPAASIGFDFAIIEECQLTGECDDVSAYYGAAGVFEIEYWYDTADSSSGTTVPARSRKHFDAACQARGAETRIVIRNRDVRPAATSGYYRDACGPVSGL